MKRHSFIFKTNDLLDRSIEVGMNPVYGPNGEVLHTVRYLMENVLTFRFFSFCGYSQFLVANSGNL